MYYTNQKDNIGGYCSSTEVPYSIHPLEQPRKSAETGDTSET